MNNVKKIIYYKLIDNINKNLSMCNKMIHCTNKCCMFEIFCVSDIGGMSEIIDVILGDYRN